MINKTLLLILDGWGVGINEDHNAIFTSKPTFWNSLVDRYPHTTLHAKEESVGLPFGCLSGSEVGHTTIGAGRIVWQNATQIDLSINNESFYQNPVFNKTKEHLKNGGGKLHLAGLLSDGGIHSHIKHLLAFIEWSKKNKIPTILHLFLDGRDMSPTSAAEFIKKQILPQLDENITIGTICGRAIAMDRNQNWERSTIIFNHLTNPSEIISEKIDRYLEKLYEDKITDEFVPPAAFSNQPISTNDAVIFFNLRADRMRQLCQLFLKTAPHTVLNNIHIPKNLFLASLTEYSRDFKDISTMFAPQTLNNLIGEWISKQGLNQFRISESEKYAHITYFFNGGREQAFANEERLVIPSLGLTNYAATPEMSLPELTTSLIRIIQEKKYEFIVCNIANGDMVGHSGDMSAGKLAVLAVDFALSKIVPAAEQAAYSVIITADHGNIEHMTEKGEPHTAHTFNNVPLIITNQNFILPHSGFLHQVSPTILKIMGLPIPEEMTSDSLV
jgi:2,3-bisphosphoglycerate-independent phosphoglycerate mutase